MKKRDIIIDKGISLVLTMLISFYQITYLATPVIIYPSSAKFIVDGISMVKGLPKKLSDLQISYIPKLFERGFSYRDISYNIFNREASTATIKRWHFLYIKKYGL